MNASGAAAAAAPPGPEPLRLCHVVERQRLEVIVASREAAFALLERFGEINRTRLLPRIEALFDEFAPPGEIVRIERLDLDLGSFAPGDLDRIEERLESALRKALTEAVRSGSRSGPGRVGRAGAVTEIWSLLDAFEHYLLHGTWPYRCGLDRAAFPAAVLERLLEEAPVDLARMLRRHGRSERLVERLVRQMPPQVLARLLERLEPSAAAHILVYLAECEAAHAVEPVVVSAPADFSRLLWSIVLRDALHDSGLHSNRRRFVETLVEGLAAARRCSFGNLVAQLRRGLEAMPAAARAPGSLLSILEELGTRPGSEATAEEAAWSRRNRGALPWFEAMDALRALLDAPPGASRVEPERMARLIGSLAGSDPAVLRRQIAGGRSDGPSAEKLAALGEAALLRLVLILAPRGSAARSALRLRLGSAPGAALLSAIAAELLGGGDGSHSPSARSGEALWALARQTPGTLEATVPLLAETAGAALLFGALPREERELALELAQLWGGANGFPIPAEKLARALGSAAAARLGGGAKHLAAAWLENLARLATAAELRDLERRLAERWPDSARHAAVRAALRLPLCPGDAAAPPPPERGSPAWLVAIAAERPAGWRRLLAAALRKPGVRQSAAACLPSATLARLVCAAAPDTGEALLRAGRLIDEALSDSGGSITRTALWDAILAAAASGQGAEAFLAAALAPKPLPGVTLPRRPDPIAVVGAALGKRAAARGESPLVAAAAGSRSPQPTRSVSAPRQAPNLPPEKSGPGPAESALYIGNAGLVLAAAFLPQLFERLGYVENPASGGSRWRNEGLRDRAVHLCQYLVDGRCDRPEPMLALNKLLCGQPVDAPALAAVEPTPEETDILDALLAALLAHWPPMAGSSVEALRETFLQREGALRHLEGHWQLRVQGKVLDVLLGQMPWSYSTVVLPWMPEPIMVEW